MALCRALIKIHVKNAANLNPDPLYAALKFSHPQLTERLAALDYKAKNSQEDEEIGESKPPKGIETE